MKLQCLNKGLYRNEVENVVHMHFTEYHVIRECSSVFKLWCLWRYHHQL